MTERIVVKGMDDIPQEVVDVFCKQYVYAAGFLNDRRGKVALPIGFRMPTANAIEARKLLRAFADGWKAKV